MREDQKNYLSKQTKEKVQKVMVAFFEQFGAKTLEDIIPNTDFFISELVDKSYEVFSEAEIDDMIRHDLKYAEKIKWSEQVVEEYYAKYMEENSEQVEKLIMSFQGE